MKYDFTTILDRRGHDARAVDTVGLEGSNIPVAPKDGFDFIPMWIADMNFPICQTVIDAIVERAQIPHYGYFDPSDEYYNKICAWHAARNGVDDMKPEHIGYENGVLGGLVSTVTALAAPGDTVLLHSPTYTGFTTTLENAGYHIELSPLSKDSDGVWRMDYDDMASRLEQTHAHVAVFCSPHNPTGRVWEREEIARAMEVYRDHDCLVVSDEIWSDIILPGHKHVPTQSVYSDARQRTVALYAPSKTFNIAGLVGSYHVIYNDYLRDRVEAQSSKCHYNDMNVLSMHALIGAYSSEGQEWLGELLEVLDGNVTYACDFIAEHFEGVDVSRPQGPYMLFADCSEWLAAHGKTLDELLTAGWEVGVGWQDGRPFHGETHIRINLASPLSRVQEAFDRLDKYVFNA